MSRGFEGYLCVLVVSTIASFLTSFTTSSIAIALPFIAEDFHVSLADVNWVANVFLMSLASTVLVVGRVSDWLGRERVFTAGVALFAATSLSYFLVSDYIVVLVCRFIQGLAGAMISGTAVALLSNRLPSDKRGIGVGINTMAVYLGLSLGPLIGGYLTSYFTWRSLFLLKALISLVCLVLAIMSLSFEKGLTHRPSIPVSLLVVSSVIMTIYGASSINSLYGLTLFISGCILLITVFHLEYCHPRLLHYSMFKKAILAANIAALLNYSATYALTIILSNYLQRIRGLSPSEAGLLLTTQPIVQATLSPIAGLLADKYDPSTLASMGMMIIALGVSSLTLIAENTPLNYLTYALLLLGVGFAFFASPNTTAIVNMAPRETYGTAISLLATVRFFGQALSTSIITSVMSTHTSLLESTKISLVIYVAISVAGALISLMARSK